MISNNESKLVEGIINFSEHIISYGTEEKIREVHERLSFCIEDFSFWHEINRKERSVESLKNLLRWLVDTAENDF
jgi:hypothetical protein